MATESVSEDLDKAIRYGISHSRFGEKSEITLLESSESNIIGILNLLKLFSGMTADANGI